MEAKDKLTLDIYMLLILLQPLERWASFLGWGGGVWPLSTLAALFHRGDCELWPPTLTYIICYFHIDPNLQTRSLKNIFLFILLP